MASRLKKKFPVDRACRGIDSKGPLEALRSEEGSSLVAVTTLLVIVTLLAGIVLSVQVLQHALIQRGVHRAQAFYAAEAGVHRVLARLEEGGRLPTERRKATAVRVPGADRCSVRVEPHGGFFRIWSSAVVRGQRRSVRALAGAEPPPLFEHAVALGGRRSKLTVAGETRIVGDVAVGERGVEQSAFRGAPFTGAVDGDVIQATGDLASYETRHYEAAAQRLETLVRGSSGRSLQDARRRARRNAAQGQRADSSARRAGGAFSKWGVRRRARGEGRQHRRIHLHASGTAVLTPADSILFSRPVAVTSAGDLRLEGPLSLPAGSIVAAAGEVRIEGNRYDGRDLLFYGREGITIEGGARLAGQFISPLHVSAGGTAHLVYPSVVSVLPGIVPGRASPLEEEEEEEEEEDETKPRGITLSGSARVDGTVILAAGADESAPAAAEPGDDRFADKPGEDYSVVVGPGVRIRGGLYSSGSTELKGSVQGTVAAREFSFYEAPTRYVNWLKGADVNRAKRPEGYLVPAGFDDNGPALKLFYLIETSRL